MNARAITFGSPSGEPSITTTRPMPQQMCEKSWTLPTHKQSIGKIRGLQAIPSSDERSPPGGPDLYLGL